jgi:hypothetical protein
MAAEIQDTMLRFQDRKLAALGERREGAHVADGGTYRRAYSGLDLDFDELREVKLTVASSFVASLSQGCHPAVAAAELFADGLATGLLLAEERQKAEASS